MLLSDSSRSTIIDNQKSQIEVLKSENERYRIALNISPAGAGTLLTLSNKELRAKADSVVKQMREVTSILNQRTNEIMGRKDWDGNAKKSAVDALMRQYDNVFINEIRSEAFNVDFALRSRLGQKVVAGIIGITPSVIANDGTAIDILQLSASSTMPIFKLGFLPTLTNGIEQMAKLLPLDR
jgi:hypothetical protein